ncbi:uncharacterized protein V1516DRAFT_695185 [Lipomyces oligophaga]|uniref:uncharacterized protein n=1 Tax=Lipomyces oligophaga TaxID=45792 RepID=UPI0034CEC1C0
MASTLEDNSPFEGANELSSENLQTTDHFAAAFDGDKTTGDSSMRAQASADSPEADGFPNYKDSYDTSSHVSESDLRSTQSPHRSFTSRIEQLLSENPDLEIIIVDAGKNHEGSSGGYITYTIRTGDLSVRRRYSEFESLRNALVRLFPTLIVPPIPEKHTVSDYAARPTKAKEDVRIIDHRRRMLAVFLNRCRAMKQIREHPVFQKFLDPNVSWIEVLNLPPLTLIPKYVLRAPPLNTAAPTPAHAYLPVPAASARLQEGEAQEFASAEINAKEYEVVMSGGIEKINKRMLRRYGDIAREFVDLGVRYNAWSLNENSSLGEAIESVGQAHDAMFLNTEELITSLSRTFTEPLSESAQFAAIVRTVLKYRHQKALQLEMTQNSLAAKRAILAKLERTEMESQRISEYLTHGDQQILNEPLSQFAEPNVPDAQLTPEAIASAPSTSEYASAIESAEPVPIEPSAPEVTEPSLESTTVSATGEADEETSISSIRPSVDEVAFPPTHADSSLLAPSRPAKRSNGFKFPGIGKLSDALHGIVDNDPEATRRNNIGKNREEIHILEQALRVATSDLTQASDSVKSDLERYQRTKEADLRRIMVAYAKCHMEWAKKNLDNWVEAKAKIDNIKVK